MYKELTDEQAESVVGESIEITDNHHDRTTTIKLNDLNKEYIVNQSFGTVTAIYERFKKENSGKYSRPSEYEMAFVRLMKSRGWI